jgi:hypothetical protein
MDEAAVGFFGFSGKQQTTLSPTNSNVFFEKFFQKFR